LSVDQFVDVGHEVANGFGIGFVDLLEQLDVCRMDLPGPTTSGVPGPTTR
jgi:hypothetical protein